MKRDRNMERFKYGPTYNRHKSETLTQVQKDPDALLILQNQKSQLIDTRNSIQTKRENLFPETESPKNYDIENQIITMNILPKIYRTHPKQLATHEETLHEIIDQKLTKPTHKLITPHKPIITMSLENSNYIGGILDGHHKREIGLQKDQYVYFTYINTNHDHFFRYPGERTGKLHTEEELYSAFFGENLPARSTTHRIRNGQENVPIGEVVKYIYNFQYCFDLLQNSKK